MAFPKIIRSGKLEKKVLSYTIDEHNLKLVNHEAFRKYVDEKTKELELLKEKIQSEALDIKDKAEQELRRAQEQARTILIEARKEEQKIFSQREEELAQRKSRSESELETKQKELDAFIEKENSDLEERRNILRKELQKELYDNARKEGLRDVKEEYSNLIDRIKTILSQAVKVRGQMILNLEQELNVLVSMIVSKVIKRIGETDRTIISQIVVDALKNLRGREEFIIRINTQDLEHLRKDLSSIIKKLEIDGKVTVVEDSRIELGGCIIETELGSLDAQLSSQLREIERSIRESELLTNAQE